MKNSLSVTLNCSTPNPDVRTFIGYMAMTLDNFINYSISYTIIFLKTYEKIIYYSSLNEARGFKVKIICPSAYEEMGIGGVRHNWDIHN